MRNPCFHPGDIRLAQAVNIKSLHNTKNAIVFPSVNCAQSFTINCSGGDLDGDRYSIIWDELLVPNNDEKIFNPPCNYESIVQSLKQK